MALTAEATADGSAVRVRVPPTRSDVLHACDVIEARSPPVVLVVSMPRQLPHTGRMTCPLTSMLLHRLHRTPHRPYILHHDSHHSTTDSASSTLSATDLHHHPWHRECHLSLLVEKCLTGPDRWWNSC